MEEASASGSSLKRVLEGPIDPYKRMKTFDESPIGAESTTLAGETNQAAASNDEVHVKKENNVSRRRNAGGAKERRGKEKDGRNPGRRARKDQDATHQAKGEWGPREGDDGTKGPRYPKKQCALLIGFRGTGCKGMQYQPDARTIEGVLFDAMIKAGAVSQDNANDPSKVNLGRAARTDAGVHAAGNLVSLKMIMSMPGAPDMVIRINKELPPEIRVWGCVRVQNSFNARLACDSRKYTYFFPSYMLIPPKPGGDLHEALKQPSADTAVHPFWTEAGTLSTPADDTHHKRQWRVSSDQVLLLRESAKKFEGTHNFHNFTVGRDFSDRSCQRHMKSIEISNPVVYGDTEWISVMLHGQSFMLHQRKMMSALVLSCRTGTPSQIIDEMYGPRTVHIPKMPSLGLLLDNPLFDSYNQRISGISEKLQPTDPEYRPPIDFEIHRNSMEEFKQRYIYDNMRVIEDRDGIFDAWIRSVDSYGGNDLLYLNPQGIIPVAAVVKRGEKRAKPFKETEKVEGADATTEREEDEEVIIDKLRLKEMEG